MESRWRFAIVLAGVLALCCVVTLTFNEETKVSVKGHDGMMYEHEDKDSDDMTAEEKSLLAAATGKFDDSEIKTMKYSEVPGVHNKADKNRKTETEDAEDDLSDEDKELMNAAHTGIFKPNADTVQKAAKAKTGPKAEATTKRSGFAPERHSSQDKDEPTLEEQALLAAASQSSKPHPKREALKQHEAPKQHQTPKLVQHQQKKVQKKFQQTDQDEPSPEDQALLAAASHHLSKSHPKREAPKHVQRQQKKAQKKTQKKVPKQLLEEESATRDHGLAFEEKRLKEESDALTPEEAKLVADANKAKGPETQQDKTPVAALRKALEHPVMIGSSQARVLAKPATAKPPTAASKNVAMKRAMEKITKAAAQQAVAEQTASLRDQKDAQAARPVVGAAPQALATAVKPNLLPVSHAPKPALDARSVIFGGPVKAGPAPAKPAKAKIHVAASSHLPTLHMDSWEKKLQEADQRASAMANDQAVPLSTADIARAKLMRAQIQEEQRNGAQFSSTDPPPLPPPMFDV